MVIAYMPTSMILATYSASTLNEMVNPIFFSHLMESVTKTRPIFRLIANFILICTSWYTHFMDFSYTFGLLLVTTVLSNGYPVWITNRAVGAPFIIQSTIQYPESQVLYLFRNMCVVSVAIKIKVVFFVSINNFIPARNTISGVYLFSPRVLPCNILKH